jgi:hypothetical protein
MRVIDRLVSETKLRKLDIEEAYRIALSTFEEQVVRGSENDCWIWSGNVSKAGYGLVRTSGFLYAHRMAWEVANDAELPKGKHVMHSCDNPPCVNPDHLRVGSLQENNADMLSKGRQARGAMLPQTKLSEAKVRAIRVLRANGFSQECLGEMFDVSREAIRQIDKGRAWRHVA